MFLLTAKHRLFTELLWGVGQGAGFQLIDEMHTDY